MKRLLSKYWIRIIGILLGALGGYIYYIKIGCNTGTCPITSDPTNSMLYGALMGFLLSRLFIPSKKVTAKEKLDKK